MKPPIKDTPKEDKPPNKVQVRSTLVYTLYRKSPLKEDNLSTKDKTAGPKGILIKRFHCTWLLKCKAIAIATTAYRTTIIIQTIVLFPIKHAQYVTDNAYCYPLINSSVHYFESTHNETDQLVVQQARTVWHTLMTT